MPSLHMVGSYWVPAGIPIPIDINPPNQIIGFMSPLYLPSGKLTKYGKSAFLNGEIPYKSPFSIAMLVYQRVSIFHL